MATPIVGHNDPGRIHAERLTRFHEKEALDFLSRRPVYHMVLSGLIVEHGMVSPKLRGTMFGCRDAAGNLTGVALVGKNTIFEAADSDAAMAFAECARECADVRMIFSEEKRLIELWRHYGAGAPMPKISRHRSIRSGGSVSNEIATIPELRVAVREDLDQIVAVHAEMVYAETGVNPLDADADGFRMRCGERVDQGRVWVWASDGEMIFKTDILIETPAAIYLEGLWIAPHLRANGYGTRCLATLCRRLTSRSVEIYGFVDTERACFSSLYRRAGFTEVGEYAKIYI